MANIPMICCILHIQSNDNKLFSFRWGKIYAHATKSEFEMRVSSVVPWNSKFEKAPWWTAINFPY